MEIEKLGEVGQNQEKIEVEGANPVKLSIAEHGTKSVSNPMILWVNYLM